jgi:hypothetical protein
MNAPSPAPKIETAAEAENLARHLLAAMDALIATIEEETALVRAGKLKDAAALEATKNELTRLYVADAAQVKANRDVLSREVPELLAELHKQHDTFNALLQMNLTVLATAHAVSESLIRGAAAEVARKAAPQTYGMSGRQAVPPRAAAQPVSVSRTL